MYQSDTIVTVLKRLNVTYFLPAIQREFVWKPAQVISILFGSSTFGDAFGPPMEARR
jgi:hypothetical protein